MQEDENKPKSHSPTPIRDENVDDELNDGTIMDGDENMYVNIIVYVRFLNFRSYFCYLALRMMRKRFQKLKFG